MSDLSVKTYAPCYNIDRKTGKGSYGTYDYSRLLEQQARLAKQEPDIGTYKLTDRELRQLAEKYDPSGMSEKEYESLIQDLVKKGVLGQSETCDIGLNRVVLRPGHLLSCDVEPALSAPDRAVNSLRAAGGDALRWVDILQKKCGGDRIKAGGLQKVYDVLRDLERRRTKGL